jgi:hypothetical protein
VPSNKIDLDAPLWGCRAIAEAANIMDDDGEPDEGRTFYLLQKGLLPASKVGRTWTSTQRRLRSVASG